MIDFFKNEIIYNDLENIYSKNINWDMIYNKTVFITGAYGMLASYIVFHLIFLNEVHNANIKIVVVVRNKEKLKKRFGKYVNKDYFHIYSNNINESIVYDYKVHYIIHAASFASPQFYSTIPTEVLKPNVIGMYHLLEFSRLKDIDGFLFFSTGDIYGDVKDNDKIDEKSYGVTDPLDIHSCYGESKRMGETMCKSWNHQYGVPTKIVRIWHTYGPTMDLKGDTRVFASFTNDIVNNRNIEMKSDGLSRRSFCYISDAIVGYFKVLFEGEIGEAYNVCNSDEFISIAKLAENMVNIFPQKNLKVINVIRGSSDPYLESTINHEAVPDNTKLKNLGWNPEINTIEGFKRVILSKKTEYQFHNSKSH